MLPVGDHDANDDEETKKIDASRRYSTNAFITSDGDLDISISDFPFMSNLITMDVTLDLSEEPVDIDVNDSKTMDKIFPKETHETNNGSVATNGNERNAFTLTLFWVLLVSILLSILGFAVCTKRVQEGLFVHPDINKFLVNRYKRSSNLLAFFPTSYEVFVSTMQCVSSGKRKTKNINNDFIPVFFDLQGIESDLILTTLTDCFNMKGILVDSNGHLNNDSSMLETSTNPDFIYTNSLCEVSKLLKRKNRRARIYMIMYNPIIRSLMSFRARQNKSSRYFDERLLGLSFHQYLSFNKKYSLEIGNALSKAILCKEDSHEVTKEDHALVRQYLDEFAIYDTLQNSKKVFDKLIEEFPPVQNQNEITMTTSNLMNDSQRDCVKTIFIRKSNYIAELYSKNIGNNNFDRFLQEMHDVNEYDSMLYIDKHLAKIN